MEAKIKSKDKNYAQMLAPSLFELSDSENVSICIDACTAQTLIALMLRHALPLQRRIAELEGRQQKQPTIAQARRIDITQKRVSHYLAIIEAFEKSARQSLSK